MPDKLQKFDANDVEIIERKNGYNGFFLIDQFRLKHRLFAGGWGKEIHRELFIRQPGAGVLLYDPDVDKVVLVEQFRIGAMIGAGDAAGGPWVLELIAGIVEQGELAEQVVRRETVEESGCQVGDLLPICEYFNSPGGSVEKITLFCGRVNSTTAGGVFGLEEEGEDIRVVLLPRIQALEKVENGAINKAMTIIALQWLALNKENVCRQWGC